MVSEVNLYFRLNNFSFIYLEVLVHLRLEISFHLRPFSDLRLQNRWDPLSLYSLTKDELSYE